MIESIFKRLLNSWYLSYKKGPVAILSNSHMCKNLKEIDFNDNSKN